MNKLERDTIFSGVLVIKDLAPNDKEFKKALRKWWALSNANATEPEDADEAVDNE